jgi:hypothetical protein
MHQESQRRHARVEAGRAAAEFRDLVDLDRIVPASDKNSVATLS